MSNVPAQQIKAKPTVKHVKIKKHTVKKAPWPGIARTSSTCGILRSLRTPLGFRPSRRPLASRPTERRISHPSLLRELLSGTVAEHGERHSKGRPLSGSRWAASVGLIQAVVQQPAAPSVGLREGAAPYGFFVDRINLDWDAASKLSIACGAPAAKVRNHIGGHGHCAPLHPIACRSIGLKQRFSKHRRIRSSRNRNRCARRRSRARPRY